MARRGTGRARSLTDVDGNTESRRGTISIFSGPTPHVGIFDRPEEESAAVGRWIANRLAEDFLPHEVGVIAGRTQPCLHPRVRGRSMDPCHELAGAQVS